MNLIEKLAKIAHLHDLNSEPEFGGTFFQRKLSEMTASRISSEIEVARPDAGELPPIDKVFG